MYRYFMGGPLLSRHTIENLNFKSLDMEMNFFGSIFLRGIQSVKFESILESDPVLSPRLWGALRVCL